MGYSKNTNIFWLKLRLPSIRLAMLIVLTLGFSFVIPRSSVGQSTVISTTHNRSPPKNSRQAHALPSTFPNAAIENRSRLHQLPTKLISGPQSLTQLAAAIAQLQFQVYLDKTALTEEAIRLNDTIELDPHVQSLGKSIEMQLDQLDICLLFHNEIIVITSRIEMEDRSFAVTYDITDLNVGFADLINSIQTSCEPLMWEENGGPTGISIAATKINNRRLLTITAPSPLQFKVRNYLNSLQNLASRSSDASTFTFQVPTQKLRQLRSTPIVVPQSKTSKTIQLRRHRQPNERAPTGGIF